MKVFSQNDISGIAQALMTFLSEFDGKSRKSKSLVPVVHQALGAGLTLDQVFNRENYFRASEKISGLSAEDYVTLMATNEIVCREIKDEDGWCDDKQNMYLLAKCFHKFYLQICPKGGTWGTENAIINLENAIKKHSFQALMSEESIRNAMGESTDRPELTCFNYIQGILKGQFAVSDEMTELQRVKMCRDEEMCIFEDLPESEDDDASGLAVEPVPEEDDEALFEPWGKQEFPEETYDDGDVFISFMHPREMKRSAIQSIIYNYEIAELQELICMVPDVTTLSDFVEKLTDGNINIKDQSIKARQIHQYLNGDLMPTFINCINMQGYEMTDEMAQKHDPLMENWDFRDEKTRKVHKLKQLIYNFAEEDRDLLDCIPDIERFFN